MKCPHCLVEFHDSWTNHDLGKDRDGHWSIEQTTCPACTKFVLTLTPSKWNGGAWTSKKPIMIYPKTISRSPLSPLVDQKFSKDYNESCLVLSDSPKASAALSRRCLQNLLREKACVTPNDLSKEIQQVIDSGKLPTHLSESIDSVRNIGNFGAHPIKSTNTGEVVDVETGEAEWLLDTLESLFDFYFVQPELAKQKKLALNKKLKEAGKPPMK